MDSNSKLYPLEFREQIFRNNTHFFDMPESVTKERDQIALKYGFPTSEEE